ncbi:MAG: DUF5684 domain-containing protein [Candidatus Limisoma sp.]
MAFFVILAIAIAVFCIVAEWKLYSKANQPGWAIFIPIYNILALLKIAKMSWWNILLLLIPVVNIVIAFMIYINVAKNYGKDAGFGVGMIFLPIIFIPIIAFGSAVYVDNRVAEEAAA